MKKKIVIIGAGTAGLAAAVRLQSKGFQVEIYESNPQVGGRMYQLQEKGFKFDVGPTIVMMPDIYREVFKESGANPDDYIPMTLLDPMYSIYFEDKSQLSISTDLTKLVKSLEAISEEDTQGYLSYLADIYKRYLIAKEHFIFKTFNHKRDFFNPKTIWQAIQLKTFSNAYSSVSKFVKADKLRKGLSFQTLYIGLSPFVGPSIYTIIPMIELLYGVWYIKGGMYSMAKGMERRFLELGGTIHLSSPVEEILIENKQATGVQVKGKKVKADIVLSNVDFPWVMKNLIRDLKNKGKYTDKKIDKMEYSSSSFLIYLGLDKKYPTGVHAIRFATDFKKNIEDLFSFVIPEDPSFYMYSPTQVDETIAPKGKEIIYVLVPVPSLHQNSEAWTENQIESYKKLILDRISKIPGFEDVKEHIEVLKIMTPKLFEKQFNLQFGATFGLKPTLLQSNNFRPQSKALKIKNLYFAGSSNHPGAGVPIVLTSAKLVVQTILEDFPDSKKS